MIIVAVTKVFQNDKKMILGKSYIGVTATLVVNLRQSLR